VFLGVCGVVILGAIVVSSQGADEDDPGSATTATCLEPSGNWLDTLQGAFYREHRQSDITDAAYVEAETPEGTAYYVAVTVDGVSGVAVFGTSDAPLQADPGLIAATNPPASELSDLGADIPLDSPAGDLLLDGTGILAAEGCL
jgi:hypothetical protein